MKTMSRINRNRLLKGMLLIRRKRVRSRKSNLRKLAKGQKRISAEMTKFQIAAEETKARRSAAGVGNR